MLKVIKFGSEWCQPCKTVNPVFKELKEEYPDVEFVSVDIDEDVDMTNDYSIRNIPTVIFEKDGEAIDKLSGARPKSTYKDIIEKYA